MVAALNKFEMAVICLLSIRGGISDYVGGNYDVVDYSFATNITTAIKIAVATTITATITITPTTILKQ